MGQIFNRNYNLTPDNKFRSLVVLRVIYSITLHWETIIQICFNYGFDGVAIVLDWIGLCLFCRYIVLFKEEFFRKWLYVMCVFEFCFLFPFLPVWIQYGCVVINVNICATILLWSVSVPETMSWKSLAIVKTQRCPAITITKSNTFVIRAEQQLKRVLTL